MIFLGGSRCAHVELQSRMLLRFRNVIARANIQTLKRRSGYLYIMNWFAFKTSISQLELSVWNAWKKKVVGRSVSEENGMNFWSKPAYISSKPQPEGSAKCQNCNTTWIIIILDLWARNLRICKPNVSRCLGSESGLYIPRTQLTSIFEGQPSKTRPFPIKTRVIWVLGIYMFLGKKTLMVACDSSCKIGSKTSTWNPPPPTSHWRFCLSVWNGFDARICVSIDGAIAWLHDSRLLIAGCCWVVSSCLMNVSANNNVEWCLLLHSPRLFVLYAEYIRIQYYVFYSMMMIIMSCGSRCPLPLSWFAWSWKMIDIFVLLLFIGIVLYATIIDNPKSFESPDVKIMCEKNGLSSLTLFDVRYW